MSEPNGNDYSIPQYSCWRNEKNARLPDRHTRGPWTRNGWAVFGADGSVVCDVMPWDSLGTREEDHANVRLIAAAPQLLDALRELVKYADVQTDPRHCVRSRIAFITALQLIADFDSKEQK